MHIMFPLSPTRILILNHILFKKDVSSDAPMKASFESLSRIKGELIAEPKCKYEKKGLTEQFFSPADLCTYHVGKVYEDDVEYINSLFLNEARNGFAFREWSRIRGSVVAYSKNEGNKNDFSALLAAENP
jgi:hypothetical protein